MDEGRPPFPGEEASPTVGGPPPGTGSTAGVRLTRSRSNRVLGGVAGGFGRYLGIDPVLLRVMGVVAFLLTGLAPLAVAYVVAWIVIPEEPVGEAAGPAPRGMSDDAIRLVVGLGLVALGAVVLLSRLLPDLSAEVLGALVLIGIGIALVGQAVRR